MECKPQEKREEKEDLLEWTQLFSAVESFLVKGIKDCEFILRKGQ